MTLQQGHTHVLERTIPRFDRGVCDYFRARTLMSDGGPVTVTTAQFVVLSRRVRQTVLAPIFAALNSSFGVVGSAGLRVSRKAMGRFPGMGGAR